MTSRAENVSRTSAAIESATLAELALVGYAGLRVAAVARRAGVATRTVYLHSPQKSQLVHDALRRRATAFAVRVARWRPSAGASAEAILNELVVFHRRSYRSEKRLLETLADGGLPPHSAALLRDLDGVRLRIIQRIMADIAHRGSLRVRTSDATALAHALMAYPTWRLAITGPAGRRAESLIATALRATLLV